MWSIKQLIQIHMDVKCSRHVPYGDLDVSCDNPLYANIQKKTPFENHKIT